MTEGKDSDYRLTRKEARLIRVFRLLSEERKTELAVEIEKIGDENELSDAGKDGESVQSDTKHYRN